MEDRIQKLLDLYWEGETGLEEEKELQVYFNSKEVKDEHIAFAPMFLHFSNQKNISGPSFDIQAIICKAEDTEKSNVRRLSTGWIYSVAAIFVVCLTAIYFFQNKPQNAESTSAYVQEIEDPEEAYRITMQALALVSGKLNKGTEGIQRGLENVNKANIIK